MDFTLGDLNMLLIHNVGDRVVCMDNSEHPYLKVGEVYTVEDTCFNVVKINGHWYECSSFYYSTKCKDNRRYENCLVIGKEYPVVRRFINSDNCKMVSILLGGISVQFKAERFE